MKEIQNIIELRTNSENKILWFKTKYLVQINFTFNIIVFSDGFSGNSHFCVTRDQLEQLNNQLDNMHSNLSGSTMLKDNDSDSFIKFTIASNGNLKIQGQLGGSHEDHLIKFKFLTDQTCLPPLIRDFKILLLNKDE
ncbi:MAG: hypothetical protein ABI549_05070 [Flavobacterium sp.]|uniref:WapI family immunity protein n=1 Tax=Flavobacterium sp. TaxID=239 RepID=UPI0032640C8A